MNRRFGYRWQARFTGKSAFPVLPRVAIHRESESPKLFESRIHRESEASASPQSPIHRESEVSAFPEISIHREAEAAGARRVRCRHRPPCWCCCSLPQAHFCSLIFPNPRGKNAPGVMCVSIIRGSAGGFSGRRV